MSESNWACQNPDCLTVFQWNRAVCMTTMVVVGAGGKEELSSRYVSSNTRPEGCPECGGSEVDCCEG